MRTQTPVRTTIAAQRARVDMLLAEAGRQDTEIETAMQRATAAAELAVGCDYPQARADALLVGGVLHHRLAHYESALAALRAALEIYRQLGVPAGEARALRAIGFVFDDMGDYPQALSLHLQALAIDEQLHDESARADTLRTIGIVYSKAGDPQHGLAFYRQSLELSRAQGYEASSAKTLNNIGINLKNLGEAEDSRAVLQEAHALFRRLDHRMGQASTLTNLGLTLEVLDDLEGALRCQREAIALARATGYAMAEVKALKGLGELLTKLDRLGEAQAALRECLALAEKMGVRPEQAQAHRALVDLYKARGEPQEALAHFEAFFEIDRAVFNEESDRKLRGLQVRHQVAQLARQSNEDALTGLANRRNLDEHLAQVFNAARARDLRLAVALADIDHFKKINDQFSHATGDDVLRHVGRLLREHSRGADLVARYGGEEFALVFADTDAAGAAQACEKLRQVVASHPWRAVAPKLAVTVSIGVADITGAATPSDMLAAADAQLYRAKHDGRNRVRAKT